MPSWARQNASGAIILQALAAAIAIHPLYGSRTSRVKPLALRDQVKRRFFWRKALLELNVSLYPLLTMVAALRAVLQRASS